MQRINHIESGRDDPSLARDVLLLLACETLAIPALEVFQTEPLAFLARLT